MSGRGRARDEGEWVTLPARGGLERAPSWPLVNPTDRELELWQGLWTEKPQALMWERFGLEHEVALYVRRFAEVEKPRAAAILGTLVRQMADSLGLTTPGMRSNRWRVDAVEVGQARSEATSARKAAPSSRDRLRVIPHAASE